MKQEKTITKYICDRCKSETNEKKVSELTVEISSRGDNEHKISSTKDLDLCSDCFDDFRKYMILLQIIDPSELDMAYIPCPYCNGQGRHGSYLCPFGGSVHPYQLICPKCGHSKSDHFEGSYNSEASEIDGISECGMELQFVCGCHSMEFKYAIDWYKKCDICDNVKKENNDFETCYHARERDR